METESTKEDDPLACTVSEQELSALLASLRREPTKEATFEDRFLADFKDRLAHKAMHHSVRSLIRERLKAFFEHNSGWSWAYGCLLAVTVGAVSYTVWPQDEPAQYTTQDSIYDPTPTHLPEVRRVSQETTTDIQITPVTDDKMPTIGHDLIDSRLFPQHKEENRDSKIIERLPLGSTNSGLLPDIY